MSCRYVQLDLAERRKLARLREARVAVDEIAARLGRHRATIFRELRRNRFVDAELPKLNGYYAANAQEMAQARRSCRRKLIIDAQLRAAVIDRLKTGWSPEQITGRMVVECHPVRVSHETIYRFAYSPEGRQVELYRHLPEHRRNRRRRGTRRRHGKRFANEVSISLRPDVVGDRIEFGHWEADLMMFRKEFGRGNVLTLVERVSRFTLALRNRDRQSKPIMESLVAGMAALPFDARRSITFDRGTEFTAWPHLQAGLGAATWFCDPQAPWQKGSVENTNGRLRRYLPRELDPTSITDRYLKSICDRLNATPRKCLGYRTPAEVFRDRLMEEANAKL
jgi:transposase, IS30 family